MAIVGLFLILAAGGLTVDVLLQNTSSINVDAVGQTFTVTTGWLFVVAVAAGAVGLLGAAMILGGMGRARGRRLALADSRDAARHLQTDRDRLASELDRERAGNTSPTLASSQPYTVGSQNDRPATIDLSAGERSGTATIDESGPRTTGREADAVGRHGIFHRQNS